MIVDKAEFDEWLTVNKGSAVVQEVATPAADMVLYKDSDGEILAVIACPTNGDAFMYEVR